MSISSYLLLLERKFNNNDEEEEEEGKEPFKGKTNKKDEKKIR